MKRETSKVKRIFIHIHQYRIVSYSAAESKTNHCVAFLHYDSHEYLSFPSYGAHTMLHVFWPFLFVSRELFYGGHLSIDKKKETELSCREILFRAFFAYNSFHIEFKRKFISQFNSLTREKKTHTKIIEICIQRVIVVSAP